MFAVYCRSVARIEAFLYSLGKLRTDDRGLEGGHDVGDLNTIAFLCLAC